MQAHHNQAVQNKERDDFYISLFIFVAGMAIYLYILICMGASQKNFSITRAHALIYFFGMLCHTLRTLSEYQTVLNKDAVFDEHSANIHFNFEVAMALLSFLCGIAWLLIAGFAFIGEIAVK